LFDGRQLRSTWPFRQIELGGKNDDPKVKTEETAGQAKGENTSNCPRAKIWRPNREKKKKNHKKKQDKNN